MLKPYKIKSITIGIRAENILDNIKSSGWNSGEVIGAALVLLSGMHKEKINSLVMKYKLKYDEDIQNYKLGKLSI